MSERKSYMLIAQRIIQSLEAKLEKSNKIRELNLRDARKLQAQLEAVKAVITDLDTQCTNSHAVRLLRIAIGEDDE